jgi:hypothetical protein
MDPTYLVNELLHVINKSRSGRQVAEAISSLQNLISENQEARDVLLARMDLLSLLVKAYCERKSKRMANSIQKRFDSPDKQLIDVISQWELSFESTYPVFHAWISKQRTRGMVIPKIAEVRELTVDSNRLLTSLLIRNLGELKAEIQKTQLELRGLIETFTPGLEEAFGDITSTIPISDKPVEIEGENEDLFLLARQRFDILTKKLIPRLEELIKKLNECEDGKADAQEASRLLASLQSSPLFLNFIVLLSRVKRKKADSSGHVPQSKRSRDADEYEEWF